MLSYRISSYKALSRIILATLIIPAIRILTILCSRNVVFSNKTCIWRLCKIIIPAVLIWGNTVVQKSRQQALRAYCNIYILWLLGRQNPILSGRIPTCPWPCQTKSNQFRVWYVQYKLTKIHAWSTLGFLHKISVAQRLLHPWGCLGCPNWASECHVTKWQIFW